MNRGIIPKVSIIMGVFNGEKYLPLAVESILNQTFKDFEFIIVDDASTDQTSVILNSYEDTRIKIIKNKKNLGLTKSLNKGIKIAQSDFIARQDADDQSMPDRIRIQYEFLLKNPDIGLVGSFVDFMDYTSLVIGQWKMPISDTELRIKLDSGNAFCHGSVLIRRDVLNNVGYYREKFRFTQDYELWLRISEVTKIANIDQILYKMYRGKDTISRTKLDLQLAYHVIAHQLFQERKKYGYDNYDSLKGDNPEFWLNTYYPELRSVLLALKKRNYGWYITEAIKQNDFLGAVKLKQKLSKANSERIDIKCIFKDVISITFRFLRYKYNQLSILLK